MTPSLGVASVTVSPTSVRGGGQATGTVVMTLAAPTDITVALSSSDGTVASVPAKVVIRKARDPLHSRF